MKNRKKKRFKLIKVKRKPESKKERPFVQALIDYLMKEFAQTETQAKVNAFAIMVKHSSEGLRTKTDFLKGGVILRPESCNSEYVVKYKNRIDPEKKFNFDDYFRETQVAIELKQAFTNAAKNALTN